MNAKNGTNKHKLTGRASTIPDSNQNKNFKNYSATFIDQYAWAGNQKVPYNREFYCHHLHSPLPKKHSLQSNSQLERIWVPVSSSPNQTTYPEKLLSPLYATPITGNKKGKHGEG